MEATLSVGRADSLLKQQISLNKYMCQNKTIYCQLMQYLTLHLDDLTDQSSPGSLAASFEK